MLVFLIDADNLSNAAWIDESCASLEACEGSIAVRRAYGSADNLKGLSDTMLKWAIRPFVNLALTKNTTDVALAVDAMELACQSPRPTVIAIGSGDADFVPLVVRLRERGIRLICVSEQSKMAFEAVHAYNSILYVGAKSQGKQSSLKAAPAKTSPAKKAAASAPTPVKMPVKTEPAAKAKAAKNVSVKAATSNEVTLDQILDAVPALRLGQLQPLAKVAELLHGAKLVGKNASSTKLFKKFPLRFDLTPLKQPSQVRYLAG